MSRGPTRPAAAARALAVLALSARVAGCDAQADRDYRGAVAALVVNVEPPFRGSVWAAFTPADTAFYQKPVVTNALRQILSRMKRGVFLSEGGSEFFTVFADQRFKIDD